MTKVLTLALLIGTLALTGCNNNKKATASKTSGAVPAPAPEPAPAPAPGSATTPPPTSTVPPTPTAEAGPGPDTVAAAPATPGAPSGSKVYVVKKGDTLFKIARANKTHVKDILAVNPAIKNANDIKIGEKINLP